MRILFWGTPEFAAPSLRALIGEGFDVVAVVTQPDKPQGRSRSRLVASAIKEIAQAEEIPVLQPERPRGPEFEQTIVNLSLDASVVVAYGHILPRVVIDAPRYGTFNVHASLLPRLRGAAPIQAAIREGLPETGITIMRLVPALDAGPIVQQLATPIVPDETYGELQLRLSELGAQALVEALTLIDVGELHERPQDDALATYAPKITLETTSVDWTRSALDVARTIRAYDPKPGARTLHGARTGADIVKLFGTQVVSGELEGAPGEVLDAGPEGLVVACGAGAIRVSQVQPAGRSRMSGAAWLSGRGIAVGDRLG
jgi:methionyl-tRNA formyltransferase